ncbi:hypothetical protein NP233_g4179 [Leucocoprinus birnbaumii]|uniref:Uncharacterized protein n=1 Tax=Leucocoprinus birnbaumii TaxID=56174 RepID=A0AAD5VV53_9AGAR|nr:hypothetical protein NP233_g4179 [Leucocoprinus birnbaumii]
MHHAQHLSRPIRQLNSRLPDVAQLVSRSTPLGSPHNELEDGDALGASLNLRHSVIVKRDTDTRQSNWVFMSFLLPGFSDPL